MRNLIKLCMVVMSIAVAPASATEPPPSFRITQLFSNVDGSLQFVELTETAGQNGQSHFRGWSLTSTHGDVVKRYFFPDNLPTEETAHLSIVVAVSESGALPVTYSSRYSCCVRPDYLLNVTRFLATDGGTVDFAGADQVTYDSLPTSGLTSIDHDGNPRTATVPWAAGCISGSSCARYTIAQSYTLAVEYHHAATDRYFWTVSEPDIDALDSGRIAGWQRTGQSIFVGAAPGAYAALATPVCRFYSSSNNTHFYSASTEECAEVEARFPALQLETRAAFYAALPNLQTSICPADDDVNSNGVLVPLYRLWNPATSDHRYTRDAAMRDQLVAQGYVVEGYGPLNVAMCVPW